MTTQEQARMVLMHVTGMKHEDAIEYLTAVLQQMHIRGEVSGLQQAGRALDEMQVGIRLAE